MIQPLIHQIWFPLASPEMPREWRRFAQSWRRWHPSFEYRLWGPEEARRFVAAHHADFLPTYDAYREDIRRIDALRILLLQHFGGIYADLDLECVRNVSPVLEHKRLVLSAAPLSEGPRWQARGLQLPLSTAFVASERGHPFWAEAKAQLARSGRHPEVLESTGAMLLSRCYVQSPARLTIHVVPPELFLPFDEPEYQEHTGHDLEVWVERTRRAFGVHHWAASWSHPQPPRRPVTRPYHAGLPLRIRHPDLHRERADRLLGGGPSVSCLMISRGRRESARWAVECFQRQTYRDRELVVATTSAEGDLREYLSELDDPRIRFAGVLTHETRRGAVRNFLADQAKGEILATWSEDDLFGADRLSAQVTALVTSAAGAVFLERVTLWWPARQEMAVTQRRPWEDTLVVWRKAMPRFREAERDEDEHALLELRAHHPHVLVDDPNLCLHVVDGVEEQREELFLRAARASTFRATGLDYERAVTVMSQCVPLVEYLDWLQARDPRTYSPSSTDAAQLDAPATVSPSPDAPLSSRLVPAHLEPLRRTEPPLRFLFAWELGGGLGHTVPLSQIARPLLEAGHEVHLALLDLSTARAGLGSLARHPALRIWQAPTWPAALAGRPESASYAELLFRAGYLDAGRLSGLADGWEALFRTIRPEMLLADHAPTALLVARGHDFRCAMIGTGFFDPLPGSPMPTFRDWEPIPRVRLEDAERVVLQTCNAILGARGYPPLGGLQDLVSVDEHFLLTVPELDHFEARARDPAQRYFGTLSAASHGRPVAWPRGAEPAVFAYIKGEYEPIAKVLDALKAGPWRVVAYLPGCSSHVLSSTCGARLSIVTEPVDMVEACRGCDVVVCHSGSGTTMAALMAGKPLVMLPMHLEQYLVGRRIEALGAGLVVLEDRVDRLSAALRRVVEQPAFGDAAMAFSRRHAAAVGGRVAETVAYRCQELALETREARAAEGGRHLGWMAGPAPSRDLAPEP